MYFSCLILNWKQDIVIGSTDTSSTTLEWAMTELLQHPEILSDACKELEEVVGSDNIVEEFHLVKTALFGCNPERGICDCIHQCHS